MVESGCPIWGAVEASFDFSKPGRERESSIILAFVSFGRDCPCDLVKVCELVVMAAF